VYCLCDVKLSNNHLFQEKKKEEVEFEIEENASDAIEEHIDDQVISLMPLNMEAMRPAKNKVCWSLNFVHFNCFRVMACLLQA